ncbi:hypothetical protein [Streptomyces sp. NPDC056682]|uniref:hypothetical protein n=1 Tax=Streptomyces sp. NPDC056682 TaxID=3345909 RepID=UPI00368543B7
MPRRRPGHVRAGLPRRHRTQNTKHNGSLPPRVRSEIDRLERTRNYLCPGDVSKAVRLWKEFVHRPERELWRDYDALWHHDDSLHLTWDCCGNPLEARLLLDTVMRAMSPRGARELQKTINNLDSRWTPPSPRPWP